jgi:spectinomycin phosphotransferase/16S rRNA (guanine(1405)-N(7))-methyltransferase
VASVAYRAVGFGSHHWAVTDPTGGGWFATVDDLEVKRRFATDSLDRAYGQLRTALDAARALRATGAAFVVAPVPTAGGEPLVRLTDRYAAAMYPMVDGQSFEFGGFADAEHRDAVQKMVVAVHRAPESVRRRAAEDDFAVPHRDALDAAVRGVEPPACGPYAAQTAGLVADDADRIERLLARYDELAARADRRRAVLTHGEPHGANTLRTADGWRLIDWDTTLVAPPERDLWVLGGDLTAYTRQTGIAVLPDLLEMYRLRWDIADIAVVVDRFRRPHTGDPNDDAEWNVLREVVGGIAL